MVRHLFALAIAGSWFLLSPGASALTVAQFSNICESVPGDCATHPSLQAYVGGALDLLATLDEETDYLDAVYCRKPEGLFDVPNIIRYMQENGESFEQRNAMILLVRYFEENGGCKRHD